MPLGKAEVPELRQQNMQKLITSFTSSPNLILINLFGGVDDESDTIKWESITGNRGLTPFAAPGAPAPVTEPSGVAQHSAMAAYWKEKIPFDEVFLNNLREPGNETVHERAKTKLARETLSLRNRCDRRKEWMIAKMLTAGSFSYAAPKGVKLSVDYGIPSSHLVTLGTSRQWDTGSSRNILEDIMDAKILLADDVGAKIDYAFMTTQILKLLILDPSIQSLLSKSNFGQGDLFARPVPVLSALLDLPNFIIYDEQYQITGWLTAAVTGSSTVTVYVDDATDFVVGGTLRFHDVSAGTYEDETISAVDAEAGTVTVSTAPTASFKSQEDKVTMTKKFISEDIFCMFASSVEGQKIAEFRYAPYGLGRNYGMQVDTHEEWDPDIMWVRVQNKGLPVLFNRDATYVLTVK